MKEIESLFAQAYALFTDHVDMGGMLDYSEKEFGYLSDELTDVEIGFFKVSEDDSDYGKRLRKKNFSLTEEEAVNILKHRIEFIGQELN